MLPEKIFHRPVLQRKGFLYYVFGFLVYLEIVVGAGMLIWSVTYPLHKKNILFPGLGVFAGILLILHLLYKKLECYEN